MILGISDIKTAQPGVNITPGPDGRPILGSSPCSPNYSNKEGWIPCVVEEELVCSYCGQPADHTKTRMLDGGFISRCRECAPELTTGLPRRPTKFGGSGDKNEIMEYTLGLPPRPYMLYDTEKESVVMLLFGAPGILFE